MNTQEICQIAVEIDKADAALTQLLRESKLLNLSGHQDGVALHVRIGNGGARSLTIADNSRETGYISTQVRGMEMLMLGIKKWYAGEIDQAKDRKSRLEKRLQEKAK